MTVSDQLKSSDGVLVRFLAVQVEVWGYVDLQTTFTDEESISTIMVRYIVVKGPYTYNLLLGKPFLNKLGALVSFIHFKVKFPASKGNIVTLKVY